MVGLTLLSLQPVAEGQGDRLTTSLTLSYRFISVGRTRHSLSSSLRKEPDLSAEKGRGKSEGVLGN